MICQADKNGMITIPWLLKGIYTLEQTDGSDLHERLNEETNTDAVFIVEAKDVIVDADDMNVFLNDGTLSAEQKNHIVKLGDEGVFTDKELPVKLTISKTSTFSGIPLKNAGFTLYKKEGDELKEIGKTICSVAEFYAPSFERNKRSGKEVGRKIYGSGDSGKL